MINKLKNISDEIGRARLALARDREIWTVEMESEPMVEDCFDRRRVKFWHPEGNEIKNQWQDRAERNP